jgi:hypothetical protein
MNAAWLVRHYARGGRSIFQRRQRQEAIHAMGLAVRDAFNESEEFEALLIAVVDGLRPRPEEQAF